MQLPALTLTGKWESVFQGRNKAALEKVLPGYLTRHRWYGGKAERIRLITIEEILPVTDGGSPAFLLLVRVEYLGAEPEVYSLPLTYATGAGQEEVLGSQPQSVLTRLQFSDRGEEGILYDAFFQESFAQSLLVGMARHRRREGLRGELKAWRTPEFKRVRGSAQERLAISVSRAEQSNTSLVYGDKFILKLYRRLHPGINPDLEIGRFLTEKGFAHVPQLAGAVEYLRPRQEPVTLGILHGYVPNQGDAWKYTLGSLESYFEQALARGPSAGISLPPTPWDASGQEPPQIAAETIGPYLESARLLGRRTAEMHLVLGSEADRPEFAPAPFSKLYQRSLFQSTRTLTSQVFRLLRQQAKTLPEEMRPEAQQVLELETKIFDRFRGIADRKMTGMRIRCHGDYHLGQVLYTGKDFVIIDFEGEPARSLTERKIKRSPLRDVSGMLRSFHYAAYSALFSQRDKGLIRPEDFPTLEFWARFWQLWVSAVFLKSYFQWGSSKNLLPADREESRLLLDLFVLEKAVYELGYELNNRPDWVRIPLQGIQQLLKS